MQQQKFWQELHKELDAFLRKRVGNNEDVFDLRQEILLRIHNNIDSLLEAKKLHSWIYQIARNAIVDFYRRQKPQTALPENLALPDNANDDQNVEQEVARWLPDFINELPEHYQEPIRLTEMEGLTQQEMSQRLGLKLATAKSRVQRGRQLIQKMLLDCCHLEFDQLGKVIDYHKRKT